MGNDLKILRKRLNTLRRYYRGRGIALRDQSLGESDSARFSESLYVTGKADVLDDVLLLIDRSIYRSQTITKESA